MKSESIYIIAKAAVKSVSGASTGERIRIYEALGDVMPTKKERQEAKRLAFMLKEADERQIKFLGELFQDNEKQ